MKTEYAVHPIGVVRSRLKKRGDAPKFGDEGAPNAWIELRHSLKEGLQGIEAGNEVIVLTWLHKSCPARLRLHPRGNKRLPRTGLFATRSPDRPNPIGLHRVKVLEIVGTRLKVASLEAIDGTPIIDLKPLVAQWTDS